MNIVNNIWKLFSLVLLIVIAWLALEKCNAGKVETSLTQKSEALARKVEQDSIDRATRQAEYAANVTKLQNERTEATKKLDRSEILLYQSQGTINRLTIKLKEAREQPFDSSFIYVSPDYLSTCDSLGIIAGNQDKLLQEATADVKSLIDLMNYEINLRDSAIKDDSADIAELRADFNAQTHFFNLAIKKAKPRTKVYAGVSALGNNINPFGGGEVSGMLVTKKDQAFELAAGFFGKEWYGRVGTKIKISFR